ncbi:thyrotroph embryonic factor-like [Pecten maximus]|uniref:thyrotroph embryonic factor-like n=1 Tax=Pecten maximus TaxID=6579 RepID=UPI001458FD28|nr:thyrotroph embryonic factor-like [Pecten maximus]XP_033745997.1 thyrotroph embryonic factor-like [Pecten maximus]
MQDPYSAMMHRDDRFFKPYGANVRGANGSVPTSYYGMGYPTPSHTMSHADLAGLMHGAGQSSTGLDYSLVSSSNNQDLMSPIPPSHTLHHTPTTSNINDMHPGMKSLGNMTMSQLGSGVPTSPPLSNSMVKHEVDEDADNSDLNSPTSTGSNTSGGPLDLGNGDGEINFKMPPKKRPLSVPDNQKDELYWDKRKKNNDSAKRSREARRMKEEQIALRVVFLEQENLQLRTEVSLLKSEIEKLRCMLYNP